MAQSADYTYLLQGLGEVMGGPLSSQLMERIWLMLGVEIAAHIENKFRSGKPASNLGAKFINGFTVLHCLFKKKTFLSRCEFRKPRKSSLMPYSGYSICGILKY